ncbi:unnamed protein product [Boreogadus saida]
MWVPEVGLEGYPSASSHGCVASAQQGGEDLPRLSLRYNNLLVLLPYQFAHLNQLVWLYLDHNAVGVVDGLAFRGIRRLKELVLSSNKIAHLENNTFGSVPNLRNLDLSYNLLQSLQPGHFYGLRKLQSLHLRSNGLRQILALYLQWNRIRAVNQGLPWTWHKLLKLDLSGNEIQTLDPDVFRCMPHLQILNLESNKLSSVPVEAVAAWTSLTTVSLAANAWDCRPGICPLMDWLKALKDPRDISMICSHPRPSRASGWVYVHENHSLCAVEEEQPTTPCPPPPPPHASPSRASPTLAPPGADMTTPALLRRHHERAGDGPGPTTPGSGQQRRHPPQRAPFSRGIRRATDVRPDGARGPCTCTISGSIECEV